MQASIARRQDLDEQGTSNLSPKSKILHLKQALRTLEKCTSAIRGHSDIRKPKEQTTTAQMTSTMMMDASLDMHDLKQPFSKGNNNNLVVKDFDMSSSTVVTADMSDSSVLDYDHSSFAVFSPQGTVLPFVEEEASSRRSSIIEITNLMDGSDSDTDTDNEESFVRRPSVSQVTAFPAHQEATSSPTAGTTSFAARRLAERLSSRYSATGSRLSISAKRQSLNIKPVTTEQDKKEGASDDEADNLPIPTRISASFQSRPNTSSGGRTTSRPAHAPAPLIDLYMSDSEEEEDDRDDNNEEEESDASVSLPDFDFKADTEEQPCNCSQEPTSLVCRTRSPPRSSSSSACHEGRKHHHGDCPRRRPPKRQSGVLCIRGSDRNPLGDSFSSLGGCDAAAPSDQTSPSSNPRTPPTRQSGVLSRRRADKQTPFSTTNRRTPASNNNNRTALLSGQTSATSFSDAVGKLQTREGKRAVPTLKDRSFSKGRNETRRSGNGASNNDQQGTLKTGKSAAGNGRISRADRIRNSKQGAESMNASSGNHAPKKDHCPFLIQRQATVQQEDNLDRLSAHNGSHHRKPVRNLPNKRDQMPSLVRRQMTKEPEPYSPVRSTPSPMSPKKSLSSPSGGIHLTLNHRMDGSNTSTSSRSVQRSPKKTMSSGSGILPRRIHRTCSSSQQQSSPGSQHQQQLGNSSSSSNGGLCPQQRRRLPSRQSGILSPTRALPAAGNSERRLRSRSRSKSRGRGSCKSRRESIQNLSLLVQGSDDNSSVSSDSSLEEDDHHVAAATANRRVHNKRRDSVNNLNILLAGNHHQPPQATSTTIGSPEQQKKEKAEGNNSNKEDQDHQHFLQRRESIRNMGLLMASPPPTSRRSTVQFAAPQALLDIHDITMSDSEDEEDDDDDDASSSSDEYQTYQYLGRESASEDATSLLHLTTRNSTRRSNVGAPSIAPRMINNAHLMSESESDHEDDNDDDDEAASVQSSSCALSIDTSVASESSVRSTSPTSTHETTSGSDVDDLEEPDDHDGEEETDDWDNVVPPPPF